MVQGGAAVALTPGAAASLATPVHWCAWRNVFGWFAVGRLPIDGRSQSARPTPLAIILIVTPTLLPEDVMAPMDVALTLAPQPNQKANWNRAASQVAGQRPCATSSAASRPIASDDLAAMPLPPVATYRRPGSIWPIYGRPCAV
jgi:hypothetical protein